MTAIAMSWRRTIFARFFSGSTVMPPTSVPMRVGSESISAAMRMPRVVKPR
jgi:hypothetical protein